MEALSPSEQEALNEFVVVTGISLDEDETMAKAIALLAHHDYNLNNSVLAFFDRGFDLPEPAPEPISANESHVSFNDFDSAFSSGSERFDGANYRNLQGDFAMGTLLPRLAKAPRISNKWQLDLGIHISRSAFRESEGEKTEVETTEKPRKVSVLWIIFLIVPRALSLLYSAFRYLFGLNFSTALYDVPRSHFDYEKYDENYDAKKDLCNEDIVSSYQITAEKFNECHEASQRDFHFLLVVLCDDKSTAFTQELLQNDSFKDLFGRSTGQFKETQLFVNNVDRSPEAFEVARTYNQRRIPFIFLVGNVTRDPSVMSSMSLLYKANCALGDEEEQRVLIRKLVKNLGRTLNDYNPQLVTKRYDKQEIEMSRVIKEKQDEAYLESLQSDKVKKEEKENKRKEQEVQKKLSILRKGFIEHLVTTNYFQNQVDGLSASESIRISIKLPDGRRLVQKFPKRSAIGELYLFVETQLDGGESEDSEHKAEEPVEMSVAEFLDQFTFSFELFKPLPKCCLPSSKETIEEFKNLKSGDSVLFEYVVDDDESV